MNANLTSLFWKGFGVFSCTEIAHDTLLIRLQPLTSQPPCCRGCNRNIPYIHDTSLRRVSKRTPRAVLTGMCYSVGGVMRQGSSSLTRLTGQSAMTSST